MSHLLDDDDDDLHGRQNHRELTLSTGSVLGIFFGLVLLCALFFAFGYNVGHRSAPPVVAASDTSDTPSTSTNFSSFKPAAGSPAGHSPAANPPASAPVSKTTEESDDSDDSAPIAKTPPHVATTTTTAQPTATPKLVSTSEPVPVNHPAPPPSAPAATTGTGAFVVQVAAVSHQEDAGLLVGALQRKGYAVAARSEPQDKLIHIQVGPFSNHKDADAMRQRLLADGYNAIVK
jgi:DedD protein